MIAEPSFWLIALFVLVAAIARFAPTSTIGEGRVSLICSGLLLFGSVAVLFYQRYRSALTERRTGDLELEHGRLKRSFKALQSKLTSVQTHLDQAVSDCEELRSVSQEQDRKIRALAERTSPGAGTGQG
jgi:hypothetical protein